MRKPLITVIAAAVLAVPIATAAAIDGPPAQTTATSAVDAASVTTMAPARLARESSDTDRQMLAKDSRREALRECREERRENPRGYRSRYGTGSRAMASCIRAERYDDDRGDRDDDDRN